MVASQECAVHVIIIAAMCYIKRGLIVVSQRGFAWNGAIRGVPLLLNCFSFFVRVKVKLNLGGAASLFKDGNIFQYQILFGGNSRREMTPCHD